MQSSDVVTLITLLERHGISLWLDGGWAVDALIGRQLRPHGDIDIVIQQKDLAKFEALVSERGFAPVASDDHRPWNFVLGDQSGRRIDVHVIVLDEQGNGIYGPRENGQQYPAASLTGNGIVEECSVACISPEYLVQFHTGYKLRAHDFHDVHALCERFGIEYPEEYKRPKSSLEPDPI